MKNRAEMPVGKLRPNEIPERPWQHILVNFITVIRRECGQTLARVRVSRT